MAKGFLTILAEIFNAKLMVKSAKKRFEPPSRQSFATIWFGSLLVGFQDGHVPVVRDLSQRSGFPVKDSVRRRRVTYRMFNIDGMRPIGYE